jgi:hypothetical protein
MKRNWTDDELAEHWLLSNDEIRDQETMGVGKTRRRSEAIWGMVETVYRLPTFLRLGGRGGMATIPRGTAHGSSAPLKPNCHLLTATLALGLVLPRWRELIN